MTPLPIRPGRGNNFRIGSAVDGGGGALWDREGFLFRRCLGERAVAGAPGVAERCCLRRCCSVYSHGELGDRTSGGL